MGQSAEEGRISVLLADDHHLLAETLRLYLEAQGGFAVTVVGTLDEALAALRGADFDCALLDLDMPGMFGLAGLERAMAVTTAPVVLFSGLVRGDGGMRAVELGAAGFIPRRWVRNRWRRRSGWWRRANAMCRWRTAARARRRRMACR